jgi:hypothetical protein
MTALGNSWFCGLYFDQLKADRARVALGIWKQL